MAVPDWLPGAERHPGQDSGLYMDSAAWKLLLHTTEGPTLDGALLALDSRRAWSHFVYDPNTDHLVQCVPLSRPARALKSGGPAGRTNAAKVVQIEVVGSAATSPNWTEQVNANLGRLIARLAKVVPFRPVFDLPFYGADAGFTVASVSARQRLSWDAWYRYDAICGHQHVPANDHWDPGHINTAAITAAIGAPSPTHTEELTVADIEAIMNALGGIKAAQAETATKVGALFDQWIGKQDDADPETLRKLLKDTERRSAEIVTDTRQLTGKPTDHDRDVALGKG